MEKERRNSVIQSITQVLIVAAFGYFGIDINSKANEAGRAEAQWQAFAEGKAKLDVLEWRLDRLEQQELLFHSPHTLSAEIPFPTKEEVNKLRETYKEQVK